MSTTAKSHPKNNPEHQFVYTPERLEHLRDELQRGGYDLSRLEQRTRTVEEKKDLGDRIRKVDPSVNGNLDRLVEDLALYQQEAKAKKKWSTWEYVKSIPGKLWGTVKRHPYIAGLVVTALVGAGLYYSGVGGILVEKLRAWLMGWLKIPTVPHPTLPNPTIPHPTIPQIPTPAPVPPAAPVPGLPTRIPGAEEADAILRALEGGG